MSSEPSWWRERLPLILGFGSPSLAAAITLGVAVANDHLASVLSIEGYALIAIGNAGLAAVGAGAGGLLRRDELAFRILYAVASGVGGLMVYVALTIGGGGLR